METLVAESPTRSGSSSSVGFSRGTGGGRTPGAGSSRTPGPASGGSREHAAAVGGRRVISRGEKPSSVRTGRREGGEDGDVLSDMVRKTLSSSGVDIDSTDLDTVLGEGSRPGTCNYDHTATIRKRYKQKCQKLGVIPVSMFLRQCGSETLNLSNHQLGPKEIHALAAALTIDTTLTKIDLSGNDIKDEGVRFLVEALCENHYVTTLNLARNGLTSKGTHYLSLLMQINSCINSLDISGNHLGDKAVPDIAEILQESNVLKHLNIAENDIGEDGGVILGEAISSNDILTSLDLSWNQIRLKGAAAIAKGIKENVRLLRVSLAYNGLGLEGAQVLKQALEENDTLIELDLTGTRLNDAAIFVLSAGLSKNEKLEKLVLSNNPFTNEGAYILLVAVETNEAKVIKQIDMQGVPVRDDFMEVLERIKDVIEEFKIVCDVMPVKKLKSDPIELFFKHLREAGKEPSDILGFSDGNPKQVMTRGEFNETLQAAGVPLSAEHRQRLAVMLDSGDKGLVHLGFLYRKWAEVTKMPPSSDTQTDAASVVSEMHTDADPSDLRHEVTDPEIVPGVDAGQEEWPGENTAGGEEEAGDAENGVTMVTEGSAEEDVEGVTREEEAGDEVVIEEKSQKPTRVKTRPEARDIEEIEGDGFLENDTNNLATGSFMDTISEE